MKRISPNHRKQTRRAVARKAAHRKAAKPIDLNQLVERLGRLRLNLNELLVDALN